MYLLYIDDDDEDLQVRSNSKHTFNSNLVCLHAARLNTEVQ